MLRVALSSLVVILLAPAAANAALPEAHPPGKSVAGVKLTWPLKAAETPLAPGSKLTVKVRSSHRHAKLSLIRVDARGVPLRALARRTVRSGTFSVTLPAEIGASYQLRVVVAGKRYWSWVTTWCNLCGDTVTQVDPCHSVIEPPSAEIRLGSTTVARGGSLSFGLANTGRNCFDTGSGYTLEHQQPDGTWVQVPLPPHTTEGYVVAVGGALALNARIPADADPGTYRIGDSVWAPEGTVQVLSGPFEVTG
jgi:hypothetical protein